MAVPSTSVWLFLVEGELCIFEGRVQEQGDG